MIPTVAWEDGAVVMIDQRRLPGEEVMLNKLLNEMDGLQEDSQVMFGALIVMSMQAAFGHCEPA